MNKYELAVVVSAKIEDDERAQVIEKVKALVERFCLLYTSPSPRDRTRSRMPSSA